MGCCNSVERQLDNCRLDNTAELTFRGQKIRAKVLDVYDGDTVTLALLFHARPYQVKCRLAQINAPEIRTRDSAEKQAGLSARDYLRLLILNQIVTVECGDWDKYGRMLGTIYFHHENVNELLLAKGYAKPYG